jgi:hypothetical protein
MMRIEAKFLAIAAAVGLMAGCAGTGSKEMVDCTFPDAPDTAAPGWVCDEPVEGVEVSAVGSATKSGAGHSFMKQMAATDARVQLAQQMRVHVKNMIKQYVETTGAADSETVDKVNTSVTKQITKETLIGSRVYKTKTSPTGTLYVLVGLDKSNAIQVTQDALKTSMNNDQALWQQFKASKAQDELAAEIANMQ